MALSNAQRQAKYRQKVRTGELSRIDAKIPFETAAKLKYLAAHWQCTQAEALGRLLMEAWEREGHPIPGYDAEGEPLPDNRQAEPPATTAEAFGQAIKPTLKKGEQPGQWRVLLDGEEIGTVQKEHHAAFAGSPAFDRWKPHRKGSMLDALSERTYPTREQAVNALVRTV